MGEKAKILLQIPLQKQQNGEASRKGSAVACKFPVNTG
jgi:hypothetical protein